MAHKSLHQAKNKKNDEFYTRIDDIAEEMSNYSRYFKGKVIYCNCDDPRLDSQFYNYFKINFHKLGTKKIVATCYKNTTDMFSKHKEKVGLTILYDGKKETIKKLDDDGDFRSSECVDILRDVDIVITNPPFSLFREYIKQLVEHRKKFIIVGNINAINYKETFSLIKDNKVWLGVNNVTKFETPPNREIKVIAGCWFTNLQHGKRNEKLILTKRFGKDMEYLKYDNYNAINVNKVVDIPRDYDGLMGVPTRFLQKYNPDQFEIIGNFNRGAQGRELGAKTISVMSAGKLDKNWNGPAVNSQKTYARIIIKNKKPERK